MKKIVMLLAAAVMTASVASAQDLTAVAETYNSGVLALELGNKAEALGHFQQAWTDAEALGEQGLELAEQCKAVIPQLMISIAKDDLREKKYDEAVELLAKAKETSETIGNVEKAAEATGLINQGLMQKANAFLNAKDFTNAVTVYEQIMAMDATNANAALRLGQCYNSLGNAEKAEEAVLVAAANGQEKQANKLLSNIFVKESQNAYKAKQFQEAIDFAVKSNGYLENANAYKLAGQAAFGLGKNAEALPFLEKYVELAPNAKDAAQMKYNIAATAQKLGDKEKAKAYYEQVLADPKFGPSAKQQLDALNK